MIFRVSARTAATAGTADHVLATLWNPHSTRRVRVLELHWSSTSATGDFAQVIRTSTKGTPASTITPDADNADDRASTPPSGAVMDIAVFSAQPTVQGPPFYREARSPAVGAGKIWVFGAVGEQAGVWLPNGTGIALSTPVATILQASDVTWVFDD